MTVSHNPTVDTLLEMKDAGAVTTSAVAQVGGSDKIIELKPAAGIGTSGLGPENYGMIVVDVSAIDITSDDEGYDIVLQGSTDADFGTAANIVELVAMHLGAKEIKRTDSDQDDTTGRFELLFGNWRDAVVFPYLRLYHVIVGTTPSINYTARIAKLPRGQ